MLHLGRPPKEEIERLMYQIVFGLTVAEGRELMELAREMGERSSHAMARQCVRYVLRMRREKKARANGAQADGR